MGGSLNAFRRNMWWTHLWEAVQAVQVLHTGYQSLKQFVNHLVRLVQQLLPHFAYL